MGAGIYELTLHAPDGRERKTLAWFPNEAVRQDFLLGKPRKVIAKVEKLRGLRERLERVLYRVRQLRVEQECRVLRLHQPVASLVVTGLNKTIKAEKIPSMHEGDVVFIFALAATSNSTRGLKSNMEIYGTYHNALAMGLLACLTFC